MTLLNEQPAPISTTGDVWADILADDWIVANILARVRSDMAARRLQGIERYGTPLQVGNLRDSKADAYQEIIDFVAYAQLRSMEMTESGNRNGARMWRSLRNEVARLCERVEEAP